MLLVDDDTEQENIQVLHDDDSVQTTYMDEEVPSGVLIGGGSFGQVYRINTKYCVKRGVWRNRIMVPSCDVIMRLSASIVGLFPGHFPEIFNCVDQPGLKHRFQMRMRCINDAIPLRSYMSLDQSYRMPGIYAQLYYITRVLNDASIFHNDFDVRNIMVGKKPRPFIVLDQDPSWVLEVYDVSMVYIVDMDFVSDTFTNDKDCVNLRNPEGEFRCTRDIDTIHVSTTLLESFEAIWESQVSTSVDNASFTYRARR